MKWSDSKDRMAVEEEWVVKVAQYEGISGDVVGLKEPLTPGIRLASSICLFEPFSPPSPLTAGPLVYSTSNYNHDRTGA